MLVSKVIGEIVKGMSCKDIQILIEVLDEHADDFESVERDLERRINMSAEEIVELHERLKKII